MVRWFLVVASPRDALARACRRIDAGAPGSSDDGPDHGASPARDHVSAVRRGSRGRRHGSVERAWMQLTCRRPRPPLLVALATSPRHLSRGARRRLSAIDEKAAPSSVYQDTNAVQVVTSSFRAGVADPLRGWSANGSHRRFVSGRPSTSCRRRAAGGSEVRHAGTLAARYKPSRVSVEASGVQCRASLTTAPRRAASGSMEVRDKTNTLMLGYAYAHETRGAEGDPSPSTPSSWHVTRSAGVEPVLDEMTTLSITANGLFELGDQSKPYRHCPRLRARSRRESSQGPVRDRERGAPPGRMAERVPDSPTALRAPFASLAARSDDVRGQRAPYADDWGLRATTTDLRVIHDPPLDSIRRAGCGARAVERRLLAASLHGGHHPRRSRGAELPDGDRELSSLDRHGRRRSAMVLDAEDERAAVERRSPGGGMVHVLRDALYIRDRWAYLDALT